MSSETSDKIILGSPVFDAISGEEPVNRKAILLIAIVAVPIFVACVRRLIAEHLMWTRR